MTERTPEQRPGFGQRLEIAFKTFVRAVLRLVIILVFLGLLFLGVYQGIPILYREFVQPVQENTVKIRDLEARQTQIAGQLTGRIQDLQDRLDEIEVQRDNEKLALSDLEQRLNSLETRSNEQDESLNRLDEIRSDLDVLGERLDELTEGLNELAGTTSDNEEAISDLWTELGAVDSPVNALRRELQLVKVMEMVTRSRLFLAQGNAGLARDDIQLGRNLLADLRTQIPTYQQDNLITMIARMDLALNNLPGEPSLAQDDLEILWQLLVEGLPNEPSRGAQLELQEPTPTPIPSSTPVSTPLSTSSLTPTPEITASPTPTP